MRNSAAFVPKKTLSVGGISVGHSGGAFLRNRSPKSGREAIRLLPRIGPRNRRAEKSPFDPRIRRIWPGFRCLGSLAFEASALAAGISVWILRFALLFTQARLSLVDEDPRGERSSVAGKKEKPHVYVSNLGAESGNCPRLAIIE